MVLTACSLLGASLHPHAVVYQGILWPIVPCPSSPPHAHTLLPNAYRQVLWMSHLTLILSLFHHCYHLWLEGGGTFHLSPDASLKLCPLRLFISEDAIPNSHVSCSRYCPPHRTTSESTRHTILPYPRNFVSTVSSVCNAPVLLSF